MEILKNIIHRKTFISMLFIGLSMLGYISYKNLPLELFPNVELPVMIVSIQAIIDVDPSYVEKNAVIPLEGAIGTLEGIESIDSFADHRSGIIFITYKDQTDTKYAFLKLEQKIESAKSDLSDEFVVNVLKIDTKQITNQFMDLDVRGSGGTDRIRNIVDKDILRSLESIDGIASVEIFGGREKTIEVILNKDAVESYGLTPSQISGLINQNNQERIFVGQVKDNKTNYFVNVTAENSELSHLENIVVNPIGPVRLKDVSQIFFGTKEETTYSRVNGKESVTIRLIRDSQVNMIELSNACKNTIKKLNAELAHKDIEMVIQRNSADDMEKNINMIIDLALTGGLLAIVILWLFLRNLRLVVTIGIAIPISVFSAFNFFYAYNISINSLTLIGIALAIGMLLDNSVVVLENIYRLSGRGFDRDKSVISGTKEVWKSIFAATLTTITVFLPFAFSSNFLVSIFGLHIGVSIVSTLVISLMLALLLIPIITHTFLRGKTASSSTFQNLGSNNRLMQIYMVILKSCMRFPARTIITAVVIFFITVFVALAVSVNVSEEVETDTFNLYVQMPEGSSLELSDKTARKVEERIFDVDERKDIISKIYEDQSTITIKLKDKFREINNKTIEEVKEEIQSRVYDIGEAEISFEEPQSSQRFRGGAGAQMGNKFQRMMGIGSQSERVVIKGNDYPKMIKTAENIKYQLESISSVNYAFVSVAGERPEMHLLFDQHLLSQYGITLNSIVSELASFAPQFSSNTTFKQGNDEYDITIRTSDDSDEADKNYDDLKQLKIAGEAGSTHELQEISQIIFASGMASINRVNQEKQIEVNYSLLSEVNDSKPLLDQAHQDIDEMISKLIIPSGLAVEVIHDDTDYSEYYFLIGIAAILIFMILASVFESAITPIILMFSIPLAAVGSLIALIFTGNSLLNSNTLMGFLILLGIVVNNGIILIDYSNLLRRKGFSTPRALITSGLARVRPILITAVTTIVAMLPLALGEKEYVGQIGAPFAITVIGGLSVSTIFTLVFIPTFYSGLESALNWIYKLNFKIKLLKALVFITLCWLIYDQVESFIWQMVDLFLVIILLPGLTYFVLNSVRQAKSNFIPREKPIIIEVSNVMKIYDQASRFIREWNRGKIHLRKTKIPFSLKNFIDKLLWQIPLIGFLIYFTYFHLESGFWLFICSHLVYFILIYFYRNSIYKLIQTKVDDSKILLWIKQYFERLFIWSFPFLNLILFEIRWDNIGLVIFIGSLWYIAIMVNSTSEKLFKTDFDESELTGRFSKLRRQYYALVKIIPIIGKKRKPFKALDKVSLTIESGMFGLLGPNGAGKTTLMRIICGILEQNYGKVKINGIDRNEYREELQGLIGYLPQEFGMYENMTAYEFLNYQAILKGIVDKKNRHNRIKKVLESVHMINKKHEKIGSFSGGMKQRVGIAQILLHLPRILVVDEPTAGLDPRERIRFRNLLVELSKERVVIFSTHIIEDISSSCNRVAVMNEGSIKYLGEPSNMTQIAEGKVWHFHVSQSRFQELQDQILIVNHMRDGDKIRIRCISDNKPNEDAKIVKATLEDAYLCLQKKHQTSIFNNDDK